ncbi:hypothetical protein [Streptomyces acidiscabies]|uniref:hypothetical protein n=1 Tax=Streptomyces acidiscabies TaxID=42234 RepID=UPI000951CB79|nr:hypothetical protein [Streptomyces acidiscabies]
MPNTCTVTDLIDQLQTLPGHLPVRLAITPGFPFTHHIRPHLIVHDNTAYIAENGQDDYLPPPVAEALNWT